MSTSLSTRCSSRRRRAARSRLCGPARPTSTTAASLKAGFDRSNKLTTWHHRIAVDRVGAYMDPVRYPMAGGKDFIAMLGAYLRGYDVPHQRGGRPYRD